MTSTATASYNTAAAAAAPDANIVSGVAFKPKDIKYSKSKVNSLGGKSVGVLYANTNSSLFLKTPLLLTWGVQEFVDDKSGKVSYDMSLQFPNSDYARAETSAFLQNMVDLEQKIKTDALVYAKEWFGKPKMTADAVDALWTPILKYPKNKETLESDTSRAPTLRVKLPFWKGVWEGVEIYNADKTKLYPSSESSMTPKDLIPKGSNVTVMIQCGGIWFANGKFGMTWRLVQAMVLAKQSVRGQCHLSIDAVPTTSAAAALAAPPPPSHHVVDSEESEGDDDDAVPSMGAATSVVADDSEEEDDSVLSRMPTVTVQVPAKKKIVKKAP